MLTASPVAAPTPASPNSLFTSVPTSEHTIITIAPRSVGFIGIVLSTEHADAFENSPAKPDQKQWPGDQP